MAYLDFSKNTAQPSQIHPSVLFWVGLFRFWSFWNTSSEVIRCNHFRKGLFLWLFKHYFTFGAERCLIIAPSVISKSYVIQKTQCYFYLQHQVLCCVFDNVVLFGVWNNSHLCNPGVCMAFIFLSFSYSYLTLGFPSWLWQWPFYPTLRMCFSNPEMDSLLSVSFKDKANQVVQSHGFIF